MFGKNFIYKVLTRILRCFVRNAYKKNLDICILKPDRVGDFVLAVQTIKTIVSRWGPTNCVLVVSPTSEELAKDLFPDVQLEIVRPFGERNITSAVWNLFKFRFLIGRYRFKILVCLRHLRFPQEEIMLGLVDAEQFIRSVNPEIENRMDSIYSDTLLQHNIINYPTVARNSLCLEQEAHLQILEILLESKLDSEVVKSRIECNPKMSKRRILLSPFSSSTIKEYPVEKFQDAFVLLTKHMSIPIILCATQSDEERANRMAKSIQSVYQEAVEILLPSSIHQYIQEVADSYMVVTVDNATAHIATALDLNCVVLVGGGHYGRFGPWRHSHRQVWLTNQLPCFGCNWVCSQQQPFCVRNISPLDVASSINRLNDIK